MKKIFVSVLAVIFSISIFSAPLINAQEEIWRTSLQEVQQIIEVNPLIGKYLLPPCTLRYMTGKRPFCPERGRFCSVKVWKMNISRYERLI
ncbi:MAG: hypothetical protein ACE5QV_04025 [Fidelibacterota bacterium]